MQPLYGSRAGHGLLLFLFQGWGPDLGHITLFSLLQINRTPPLPLASPPPAARLHSLPTVSCLTPSSGFACVARSLSPALVIPGRTIL